MGGTTLRESRVSRWAGLSPSDRRAARRLLLVRTGFELFGDGGEAAVSVRSVCRTAQLNSRYFYESFTDINGFFGALYDEVVIELGKVLAAAMVDFPDANPARLRAGIRTVLEFTAADRRRGRVLFAGAGANPVFASRRAAAKVQLRKMILTDRQRSDPEADPMAREVEAAIYVGALAEMAREWTTGALGDDLDLVADAAMRILTPTPILS
jgi:AcrR family transcriptional regulator